MISLLRSLLGTNASQSADQLAREIAERSVGEARRQLRDDVSTMNVAELRGYIRARASRPVRQQTRQMVAGHGRQFAQIDDLVARALERVVHIIVRQLMLQQASSQLSRRVG